jgi:hypothetical protein
MLQVSGRIGLSINTKIGLLFSILCLALMLAHSQIASPGQSSGETHLYKLNGTVLNSVTNEPIAHAMVEISNFNGAVAALTDSSGQFELSGLQEMQATVNVTKPGFFNVQQLHQFSRVPNPPLFRIGPDAPAITLKLVSEGIIFGQVQSSDGPAENIPVKIFWAAFSDGRRTWQRREVRTDDEGNFRLAELLPSTYFIAAGPGWDSNDMTLRGPDATAYFPALFHAGSPDFSGASPVTLAPGQQVQVDFAIKKTPAYTISGRIIGNDSNPGISLELRDRFGEPSFFPTRFDPTTRQFSMRVPAGSYVLHANAQGQDGSILTGQLPVTLSADRSNLEIILAPSPVITVNVRMEASSSPPQETTSGIFRIQSARNMIPVSVGLQAVGDTLNPRNYWSEQREGIPGLSLRGVEPGKYTMRIQPGGTWYVESASSGGTDLLREDLEIGSHVDPIEIVMRNDGASIQGKVRAAAGRSAHGEVLLVREGAPHEVKTSSVSDDGGFFITGLAPGGYSMVAFDHLDDIEYRNPEVLNKYLSKAEHINLDSGQQLETTIDLTEIGN